MIMFILFCCTSGTRLKAGQGLVWYTLPHLLKEEEGEGRGVGGGGGGGGGGLYTYGPPNVNHGSSSLNSVGDAVDFSAPYNNVISIHAKSDVKCHLVSGSV
jgi:hypothetical protein